MPELSAAAQTRINTLIEEIKNGIGKEITALLQEINATRLANKGKLSRPIVDRASLRWTLAWEQNKISYDLNIIIRFDDNGTVARVAGVWVHRHASTPLDYEGHTPTTRMHRLAGLTIKEIREAIDAQWK
jgi:hypothetical protein